MLIFQGVMTSCLCVIASCFPSFSRFQAAWHFAKPTGQAVDLMMFLPVRHGSTQHLYKSGPVDRTGIKAMKADLCRYRGHSYFVGIGEGVVDATFIQLFWVGNLLDGSVHAFEARCHRKCHIFSTERVDSYSRI